MTKNLVSGLVMLMSVLFANIATADCTDSVMGGCAEVQQGTSAHMRGDAVKNAKVVKEMKAVRQQAKEDAVKQVSGNAKESNS